MKQNLFFIYCILLIGGCSRISEYTTPKQQSVAVGLVVDITDRKLLWCVADPVLALYHCTTNQNAEEYFALSVISDKRFNQTYASFLPSDSVDEVKNVNDDPQFRQKRIINFYETVREQLKQVYAQFDTTHTVENSQCWTVIASTISAIAALPAAQKYVLVHSDLCEHSSLYDAYKERKHFDAASVAKTFLRADTIPQSLKNVTIVFVYLPQTRGDDIRFTNMLRVYQDILSPRGAKIIVQTTNDAYHVDGI